MSQKNEPKPNLLAAFGEDLSDAERTDALRAVLYGQIAEERKTGEHIALPAEGLEALRQFAKDLAPEVRVVVVEYLTSHGPCTWDDIEEWTQDEDRIVREAILAQMETAESAAGKLCQADKPHCVDVVKAVAGKHTDYAAGNALRWLSEQDDELLDLTWSAVDALIDQENPDLSEMLASTYLEQVVPDRNLSPDEPHVGAWINGDSKSKKRILLRIANYWGLEEGRLGDIVAALAADPDESIATIAQGITEGRVEPGALWLMGAVGADDMPEEDADEDEE